MLSESYRPTLIVPNIGQRLPWFLASVLLHLTLLTVAIAVGTTATLPERKRPDVMWLIVPPNAFPKSIRMPTPPGTGSPNHMPSGEGIDLSGLKIDVLDAPGFEMMELLAKSDGGIGFGPVQLPTAKEPVELLQCFEYPSFKPSAACGTTDGYFPIKLQNTWLALENFRQSKRIDPGLQAYALFPRSFGGRVRSAVRREAQRRSIMVVNLVILRFVRTGNGFEVALE
jgi:hypothetical protein